MSREIEIKLAKVQRLHGEYQAAMKEANQAQVLLENAQAAWNRATQKASSLREDYNFALAEYQEVLKKP
ncbi:hypothetical protein NDI39_27495 [Microcoleus sp. ZQ-A2]|nr:hypothetical protein [Microcoleus sp. FACHB-1]